MISHHQVKSRPSKAYSDRLQREEKERVEAQKAEMGEAGLAKAKEELEAAVSSRIDPPQEVLEKMPMADATKIKFRYENVWHYLRPQCQVCRH